MIFPFLLLFFIPIVFSHILAPFGVIMGAGSFERWKVFAAFFLVVLGCLEVLIRSNHQFFHRLLSESRRLSMFLLFPVLIGVSAFCFSIDPLHIQTHTRELFMAHFFLGSYEKHHGYIFLFTLAGSAFLFRFVRDREQLFRVSLLSASIVSVFALLEYADMFHFFHLAGIPVWWEGRAISTLGNPNYLAGYLLLHIPLVTKIKGVNKYCVFWLLFFGILTTKSMIGIALLGVFCMFLMSQYFLRKKWIFVVCIILLLVWVWVSLSPEKWLSLMSRGVLMWETLIVIFSHPWVFLFGAGPDSIIDFFALPRINSIDQYFPVFSPIDSSHNLWIDILFQYGVFFLGFLFFLGFQRQKSLPKIEKYSLLLFCLFFSLNPIILAPILPILLILASDPSHS